MLCQIVLLYWQMRDSLEYRQLQPTETDLGKNWDEWKKTVVGNTRWYEYYETVGLLQTKKVLEQLDLMAPEGRKERCPCTELQ